MEPLSTPAGISSRQANGRLSKGGSQPPHSPEPPAHTALGQGWHIYARCIAQQCSKGAAARPWGFQKLCKGNSCTAAATPVLGTTQTRHHHGTCAWKQSPNGCTTAELHQQPQRGQINSLAATGQAPAAADKDRQQTGLPYCGRRTSGPLWLLAEQQQAAYQPPPPPPP